MTRNQWQLTAFFILNIIFFRALGDQLEGHSRNHLKHRADTVRYMIANRKHFEPFIDIPFERYSRQFSYISLVFCSVIFICNICYKFWL